MKNTENINTPATPDQLRYKDFKPTAFDTAGSFLTGYDEEHPDRQSWYVCPVMRTRDSGPLDQSNFEAALKTLGGESETVEVHRFGHWGPGWYEIIIVENTAADKVKILGEMTRALEDYPVLDEADFSRREWDDYTEAWDNWVASDFSREIIRDLTRDDGPAGELIRRADNEVLREFFESCVNSGEYYYTDGDQVTVNLRGARWGRDDLAGFIRELRAAKRTAENN